MDKKTLFRLGSLWRLKEHLHNLWVDKGHDEDTGHKIKLIVKVKKQLEEQKRGFLKSKVPYAKMADLILDQHETLSAEELHSKLTALVIER